MDTWQNLMLAGRYKLQPHHCLGTGGTARVLQGDTNAGVDLKTNQKVAVKLILASSSARLLENESQILSRLHGRRNAQTDFPKMLWHGEERHCEWEVMELLGLSVLEQFERCEFRFSLKTVLMIADQIVEALEEAHKQGIIHMDVKPDNIVFGEGANQDILYLIDFGLSKLVEGQGRTEAKKTSFRGNIIWASVNLLKLNEGSQRDDLEAMMYTLLFLLKGELPWMRLPESLITYETVLKCKEAIRPARLFEGIPCFFELFLYFRSLKFQEVPNYAFIRKKIQKTAEKSEIVFDFQYDWKALDSCDSLEPASQAETNSKSAEKRKYAHRGKLSRKPHRQVERLTSLARSPGSLLKRCKDRIDAVQGLQIGENSDFQLRLSPVIMEGGSRLASADILSLDECPLDSTDATPKSASPTLPLSVRRKFQRLKLRSSLDFSEH